ncbi:flavodoxin-dependent (E)-4-hydroxy-3-methylbut-2-enyl-diphosphate synthase [Desulfobacula sp.]|uniref:flavodoxin-dependent (E)-4-hydroxy-3-methylbut-2-enyl-diphosphate synthase n=1 Tax=Desulfobacula sp. TaxID=2593537 RepID=UPI0025BC4396|nr:flavodoxin-dependent (E)-4-hydroxy-3-methylbut-2-enyl-diphosphate synthase [Desulfobacula sp.]MBC2703125.1 flavodoxin-dependent (E)-4-hydroxy-3-methylbut-2-enyl-diphosphate synthase [Desulfobacula sp.]
MSLVRKRRQTRQISIGKVKIGSDAPISVQSMTNTQTQDVEATVNQILSLEKAGCEIIRVAVPDMEAAEAIEKIKQRITIPIIADIHFDFRLALASARAGADALRINPGNIGEAEKIRAVVDCAKDHGILIRIGVNAGSLEKEIEQRLGITAEAMVESALRNIKILEDLDFYNIKVSLKASDVSRTVKAYRLLASKTNVPFHVGVTEAGGLYAGITKSAIGIGMLLAEGLGDTLRVSLTRDPVEEIRTGYEILRALGIRSRGPELISCPTCGRCKIDLFKIAEQAEKALLERSSQIKVAIMGCVVNGPGEAKEADIGIAGGDGMGILFKKGKVIRKIDQDKLVDQLLSEIDTMTENSEELNGKKE